METLLSNNRPFYPNPNRREDTKIISTKKRVQRTLELAKKPLRMLWGGERGAMESIKEKLKKV